MKRKAKILSSLLIAALLLGALTVLSFAALDMSSDDADGNIVNIRAENFNSTAYDITGGGADASQDKSSDISPVLGGYGHLSSVDNGEGEKYIRYRDSENTANYSGNSYIGLYGAKYNITGVDPNLANYDFATVDLDICADAYLDENGNITAENTGKLSYTTTTKSVLLFRNTYKDANGTRQSPWTVNIYLTYKENDGWYLKLDGAEAKLSTTVGEWNHISLVYEINGSTYTESGTVINDTSGSKIHFYLDGKFVTSLDWGYKSYGEAVCLSEGWFRNQYNSSDTKADFSMGIDNYAVNYYKAGYSGELSTFDFTDQFARLNTLTDIVLNGEYEYPAPNRPIATVTNAEGDTRSYFFRNGIDDTDFIGDLSTITVKNGMTLTDFDPSLYGIKKGLLLVVEDGATFALLDGCPYTISQNGDEILPADASDSVDVIFYPNSSLNDGEEIGSGTVTLGQSVNTPSMDTFKLKEYTDAGAVYEFITEWKWNYIDENGNEVHEPVRVLDDETLELFKNSDNGGVIFVYPEISTKTLTFGLYDASGVLVDTDNVPLASGGDITTFENEANFVAVTKSAPENYTVQLMKDIELSGKTDYLTPQSNRAMFIDLNGNRLIRNYYNDSTYSPLFAIKDKAILTVYSSRAGGEIINAGNKPMIHASSRTNFTVTLGAYKNEALGIDAKGDNLTIHTGRLIEANTATAGASSLTIDGGKYYRTTYADDGYAFITSATNTEMSIKNAELFLSDERAILLRDTGSSNTGIGINAVFDNCKIINASNQNLFSALVAETRISVSNSIIAASLSANPVGSITFGNNMHFTVTPVGNKTPMDLAFGKFNGEPISYTAVYYDLTAPASKGDIVEIPAATEHTVTYTLTSATMSVADAIMSTALVNVTTRNGFYINLYLPEHLTPSVYSDENCTKKLTGEATEYGLRFTASAISPASLDAATFYVKAYDGAGNILSFPIAVEMSLVEYFTRALQEDITELEEKLIVNAANYCKAIYTFVNGTLPTAYDPILTEERLTLTSIDEDALILDAANANIVSLSAVTDGATIFIGEGNIPVFAFTKLGDAELDISLHSLDRDKVITSAATVNGNYYLCSSDLGIYDMATDMTISSGDASGTYNLAAYVVSAPNGAARDAARALYAYALASLEYVTTEE